MKTEIVTVLVTFFFTGAIISVSIQFKGWRFCFGFQFEGTQPILVGKSLVA